MGRHSRQHKNKYILSKDSGLPRARMSPEARGLSGGVEQGCRGGWGMALNGHGVLGNKEPECLAKNCPGYVCECAHAY